MGAASIVESARQYLGVRFRHQGRNSSGVDCVGLIYAAIRDSGAGADIPDDLRYGHVVDSERMERTLNEHGEKVGWQDRRPGDVVWIAVRGNRQHLCLLTGTDTVIHANAEARKVVEHRIDDAMRSAVRGVWRLRGLE